MSNDEARPNADPPLRIDNRQSILFAFSEVDLPTTALVKTHVLSRALGAELHVLRVFPEFGIRRSLVMDIVGPAGSSEERSLWGAIGRTWDWMSSVMGSAGHQRLHIRSGDLSPQVASCATALQASLAVTPGTEERMGAKVSRLAAILGVPVLVIRNGPRNRVVVGATDLRDDRYPVLSRAVQMGASMQAELVALHNLKPHSIVVTPGVPWAFVLLPGEFRVASRYRHLRRAARRLCAGAEAVVASEPDPADAIVREARRRNAELVVVGARRRFWDAGSTRNGLAARVVDRCNLSVLVEPVGGASLTPFGGPRRSLAERVPTTGDS